MINNTVGKHEIVCIKAEVVISFAFKNFRGGQIQISGGQVLELRRKLEQKIFVFKNLFQHAQNFS